MNTKNMTLVRKLTVKLICGVASFLLFSCNDKIDSSSSGEKKIELTQDEYISIAFDNPKQISESQALELVKEFEETTETRTPSLLPTVDKKYYIGNNAVTRSPESGVSILIYQISLNKEKGGFALVSGDERCPRVIAYSKQGSLGDTITNKGAAYMLKEAEGSLKSQVYYCADVKDSLREQTLNKIGKELGIKDVKFEDVKDRIVISSRGYTRSDLIRGEPTNGKLWKEVKPLIVTKWDQRAPYNGELDKTKSQKYIGYGYEGRNAVGCIGTAVSQIVAHYQAVSSVYGVTLNWEKIKEYPAISIYLSSSDSLRSQVAKLCKFVAIGIGTKWDDDGEGGTSMKKVYNFLNPIGLTFETGKKFKGAGMDAARIIESLDMGFPVLVTGYAEAETRSGGSGGGHCWILDGYQMRIRPAMTRAIIKANDVYVHANFGWGGGEDGYYMVDRNSTDLSFHTLSNGYFKQDLRVYSHVRRK